MTCSGELASIALYSPVVTICTVSLTWISEQIYVFCVDLRTNSDYFPIQNKLTGFCKRNGVCLLRGTDCSFTCCLGE